MHMTHLDLPVRPIRLVRASVRSVLPFVRSVQPVQPSVRPLPPVASTSDPRPPVLASPHRIPVPLPAHSTSRAICVRRSPR